MPFIHKFKQQKVLLSVTLSLCTLFAGIVLGTLLNIGVKASRQNPVIAPDATPLVIPAAVPITNEFSKLAKRLEPSVVYIESDYLPKPGKHSAKDSEQDQAPGTPDPSDLFKHFFGKPDPRSFRTEGSGTVSSSPQRLHHQTTM